MKSNTDLIGEYERPQEHSFVDPDRTLDKEAFLGPLKIHQRDQHRGYLDFGALYHIRSERKEIGDVTWGGRIAATFQGAFHCMGSNIDNDVYNVSW